MGKNILVPIDFSKVSEEVVRLADEWAQRNHATLHCLRVINHTLREVEGESRASFLEEFETYLQELNILSPYQSYLEFDLSYRGIISLADTIDADLILMAAHSHTLLGRLFLGSNTDYVVHHCHCPVYVHKQHPEAFSNKIIVPLDYTEVNKPVVKYADTWAQRTGAELYFIHVEPELEYVKSAYATGTRAYPQAYARSMMEYAGGAVAMDIRTSLGADDLSIEESLQRKKEEELMVAQRTLEEYVAALDVKSKHQMIFQTGKPYLAMRDLQQKTLAGLVMMAAHSHTLLNRLFVGSNTDYLLHHLNCPMYVYKEKNS